MDGRRDHGFATGGHMVARDTPHQSSDRSFGLVFAAAFAVIALFPLLRGGGLRPWSLGISIAFLIVALSRPTLLAPLNHVWARFGLLLARVTNPLVMGVIFFLVITPMALIARWRGQDPLRLRLDRATESYWIERIPPGPAPASMINQF
jgi:saxitoxin biosynthesis operon SxtJ-like protein